MLNLTNIIILTHVNGTLNGRMLSFTLYRRSGSLRASKYCSSLQNTGEFIQI